MIREGDELFGQTIENSEILDVLLDMLGLGCRNALRALLTLKETLKDEVGTRLDGFAITTSLEELTTE